MGNSKARLTPFGRKLLVDRIVVNRWPVAHAAEAAGVSRQTAYRWLKPWRAEGEPGLLDRSSRPHRSPKPCSSRERRTNRRGSDPREGRPSFDDMSAEYAALNRPEFYRE
jgi:transposase-like protein